MNRYPPSLLYTRVAAIVACVAVVVQLYVSVALALANGEGVLHGVWMYLAFLTILTNLLVALSLVAASCRSAGFWTRPDVVTALASSIALVCIAYNLLLRNTWNPQGAQLVADVLLHDVDPVLYVGFWWLFAADTRLRFAQIGYWALYPAAYFGYAMLRGAATGFYPYPFIDVAALGYARVLVNATGLLIAFLLLAAAFIAIGRLKAFLRARG